MKNSHRPTPWLLMLVMLVGSLGATTPLAATTNRFEKEILAFEAADKTNPLPQGAVLFVGSSSIRLWKTLAQDFPEFKVINRGFGGAQASDLVYYADRIVKPYKPATMVIRIGGNDIAAGKSSAQVAADIKVFVAKVRTAVPEVRILFLALNSAPSRWKNLEKEMEVNRLIKEYIATTTNMVYVDIFTPMLGPNGALREELFRADRLHCSAEGYKVWTSVIRPYLQEAGKH